MVLSQDILKLAYSEDKPQDDGNFMLREFKDLRRQLATKVWRTDTSYWPSRWHPDVPSIGQCAVTALLVQDLAGGEIEEIVTSSGDIHFRNIIPGLGYVDLTADQFPKNVTFVSSKITRREEILFNRDTVRRYNLLVKLFRETKS